MWDPGNEVLSAPLDQSTDLYDGWWGTRALLQGNEGVRRLAGSECVLLGHLCLTVEWGTVGACPDLSCGSGGGGSIGYYSTTCIKFAVFFYIMTVQNVVYVLCINCILFQSCKALFETPYIIQLKCYLLIYPEDHYRLKSFMVWDIKSCSPFKLNRRFGGARRLYFQGRRKSQPRDQHKDGSKQSLLAAYFMLVSRLPHFWTLKMEATCSSKSSVDFQRTTRRYIPEDRTALCLHFHSQIRTT
jgi:hypothetical protein